MSNRGEEREAGKVPGEAGRLRKEGEKNSLNIHSLSWTDTACHLTGPPSFANPAVRVRRWLLPLDSPPWEGQGCFKGAGLVLTEAWYNQPALQ